MNRVGFPISTKKNEKRRGLLPTDIIKLEHPEYLYIEKGYGHTLGISDDDYIKMGANIVSHEEVLDCEAICDPKLGDSNYLFTLNQSKILFGYMHAVQSKDITDAVLKNDSTAIAWEDMFEGEKHIFWKNNELAGSASIVHAFPFYGKTPEECKVALIGKGNVALGALKILNKLGAEVEIFDRKSESRFKSNFNQFDVIVNALLWDTNRKDHILNRDDLKNMKKDSFIIDISCDRNGAIESSVPTSITNPVYSVDGILHYAVDHTPSLFHKTASKIFSEQIVKYLDFIITDKIDEQKCLLDATIIKDGIIVDERINSFQNR